MKSLLLLSAVSLLSSPLMAVENCDAFGLNEPDGSQIATVLSSERLSFGVDDAAEWKSIDVIASLDRQFCGDGIVKEEIKVGDTHYYRLLTAEERCDGGNTHGAVFAKNGDSTQLGEAVAHIQDGDASCNKEEWIPEDIGANHKCDLLAEAFAKEKLESNLPFTFTPQDSVLDFRDPYPIGKINVYGELVLTADHTTEARVEVFYNKSDCELSGVVLTMFGLD